MAKSDLDNESLAGCGLLLFVFSAGIGMAIGSWLGSNDCRREAVRAGAAEYVSDSSGDPQFRWITARAEKAGCYGVAGNQK